MRVFDRDLDELEEWIVCLALIYLISSIIFLAFGPFLGPFVFLPAMARSLSLIAASVALLLWLLRRFGSPLYARLRNPEKNRIQTTMCEKDASTASGTAASKSVKTMVIHFGHDDGKRLPMLRSAGYEVHAAHTLNELWIELVQNEQIDALLISEGGSWITACAAVLVREYNTAPLVLFRRWGGDHNDKLCDEVYLARRMALSYSGFDRTVSRSQEQFERREAQSVTELSRWQRARARMLSATFRPGPAH